MSAEFYAIASSYEMLIKKAFECPTGMKNGADLSFMRNAMSMEIGETYANHLGAFKKQFEKVQNYLAKALIKLSKKSKYKNSKMFFEEQLSNTQNSTSTNELMKVVLISLEEINKYSVDR